MTKYTPCFPLTEDKWKELHDDVLNIAKLSNNNENVGEIILVVYNFFGDLDKAYKKGCGEDVS